MITEKYSKLLQSLRDNPNVIVDQEETVDFFKASDRSIKRRVSYLAEKGYTVPDEKIDLLHLSSASVNWQSDMACKHVLTGGVCFNGFSDALSFYSDFWKGHFSLAHGDDVPAHLQHFEQLAWFERQARDLDGRYGCFLKQPGNFPPPVAFYNSGWYIEMDMDFETYLNAMFDMYAVKGWQYFYIDVNKEVNEWEEAISDMQIAVGMLPQVFPETDWTQQAQHLKQCKINVGLDPELHYYFDRSERF